MVRLEAMAVQAPRVARSVGGRPATLSEDDAVLLEAGDAEAIGWAITELVRRPDDARRRAKAAHRRLEQGFSVNAWVDRYSEVYSSFMRC